MSVYTRYGGCYEMAVIAGAAGIGKVRLTWTLTFCVI